jgi:hypothetical protein
MNPSCNRPFNFTLLKKKVFHTLFKMKQMEPMNVVGIHANMGWFHDSIMLSGEDMLSLVYLQIK